jgi:hypothetical protein
MNAPTAFRPSSALAAPDPAAVQAALTQLSAALGGVPVTAVECAVGDFTSVATPTSSAWPAAASRRWCSA